MSKTGLQRDRFISLLLIMKPKLKKKKKRTAFVDFKTAVALLSLLQQRKVKTESEKDSLDW